MLCAVFVIARMWHRRRAHSLTRRNNFDEESRALNGLNGHANAEVEMPAGVSKHAY